VIRNSSASTPWRRIQLVDQLDVECVDEAEIEATRPRAGQQRWQQLTLHRHRRHQVEPRL
jgi:hypothetical protein